jgi:hypothetical protein
MPPFLVYDSFEGDLDAVEVLEQVLATNDKTDNGVIQHLTNFLLACLSTHNVGDNKPHLPPAILMEPASPDAKKWAKNWFTKLFESLKPNDGTIIPQGPQQPQHNNIMALLAQFLLAQAGLIQQLQQQRNRADTGEEKKNEEKTDTETSPITSQEMKALLKMCGHDISGTFELLPQCWFHMCSEIGLSEQYKMTIIQKHIMATQYYDDAEVPLTTPLLKMAMK